MDAHWQVQEAKQRFSEVLRKAHTEGAQFVTKHGTEVAVVLDIEDYRHLRDDKPDLKDLLLSGPRFDDELAEIFEQIELERRQDFPREIDLSDIS